MTAAAPKRGKKPAPSPASRNLFRMRQFYATYRGDKKVAPLVRQLSRTNNLIILSQTKRAEEREFYVRMAVRERWSKPELDRQAKVAACERAVLGPARVSPAVTLLHRSAVEALTPGSPGDAHERPP